MLWGYRRATASAVVTMPIPRDQEGTVTVIICTAASSQARAPAAQKAACVTKSASSLSASAF